MSEFLECSYSGGSARSDSGHPEEGRVMEELSVDIHNPISIKERFWLNIDKFILAVLLLFSMSVYVYLTTQTDDAAMISWIEGIVGQFLAALLTLMVVKPK
jgi:hypothetical protein